MPKKSKAAAKTKDVEPRQLKTPRYRSFRLQKPIKQLETSKLPGAFKLFFASLRLLGQNWKAFGGIIAVYAVLNVLLVQGFSGSEVQTTNTLDDAPANQAEQLLNKVAAFTYMAGASGSANSEVAGVYQLFLAVITSLALIWTLREVYTGSKVRIRDGFYKGMHPLIPFFLVLLVVALQLVPVIVGGFVYSLVTASSVALSGVEILLWTMIFGLSILISLYMLSSSLFALYIVCLREMTPLAALRSARELVRYRRWIVMRKVLFLPVAMLVGGAILTVPAIFLAPWLAVGILFVLNMVSLAIIHSYMYRLYRELL
jgi:hypothetical protein